MKKLSLLSDLVNLPVKCLFFVVFYRFKPFSETLRDPRGNEFGSALLAILPLVSTPSARRVARRHNCRSRIRNLSNVPVVN